LKVEIWRHSFPRLENNISGRGKGLDIYFDHTRVQGARQAMAVNRAKALFFISGTQSYSSRSLKWRLREIAEAVGRVGKFDCT
jgi:hypothetical protein